MDHELLLARSITQAQHMVRSLGGCGIRSALMRAPVGLTDRGCAYGVRLRPGTLEAALTCLQAAGIKIYNTNAATTGEALELYKAGKLKEASDADVEGHWS